MGMEAEVEPTPNCTGKKRERSRSAGNIDPRTPEPAMAGGGKTAAPARWLKLEGFAQITSKLNFGGGNARGEKGKSAGEQPQVIDPKDSTWDKIVKMGNQHFITGESGDGSGGGSSVSAERGKRGKRGNK